MKAIIFFLLLVFLKMDMLGQSIYCYDNANNYCLSDIMAFNPRKIRDTLPQDGNGVVGTYIQNYHPNYCYDYPVFNPNNPNEFIYLKATGLDSTSYLRFKSYPKFDKWELWKMDICTGVTTYITNNLVNANYSEMVADFRVSYGKNGYLLPIPKGKKIGKLQENNHNFIPLDRKIAAFSPCRWNSDGIGFFYQANHSNRLLYTYFATSEETLIDSLILGVKLIDWGKNVIVYNANNSNILKTYSLITKKHENLIQNFSSEHGLNGQFPIVPIWVIPDTSVLWQNQYIMAITNIYTHKTDTILTMGDNVYMQHLDVSKDRKKIIGTMLRDEYFSVRPMGLNRKMTIFIMNIDGTEMKEILIPK